MSSSSNRATSRTDTLGAPEKASYASLGSLQVSPPPRRPPPESWYDTQVTLDVDAAWAIRQPRMRTASHAVPANKPDPRGTEVQEARAETIDPAALAVVLPESMTKDAGRGRQPSAGLTPLDRLMPLLATRFRLLLNQPLNSCPA